MTIDLARLDTRRLDPTMRYADRPGWWRQMPRVGPFSVREPGGDDRARRRSDAQCRRMLTGLRARVEHELQGDPYARRLFTARLQSLPDVGAWSLDASTRRLAELRELDAELTAGAWEGIPTALAGRPLARACFGLFLLVLGEDAMRPAGMPRWEKEAMALERAIEEAMARYSLHPHGMESAVWRASLPRLHGLVGLEAARQLLTALMQVVRVARARRDD